MKISFVALSLLYSAAASTDYKTPPPIYAGSEYTTWTKSFCKDKLICKSPSRVADIVVPFKNQDGTDDSVSMKRLDLIGDAATRGSALFK